MQNKWNFQIFFYFKSLLLHLKSKSGLSIWPSFYCRYPEYISYLFILFDIKSGMMRLCNEETTVTYTYFPKKVLVCGKSDVLIKFLVPRAYLRQLKDRRNVLEIAQQGGLRKIWEILIWYSCFQTFKTSKFHSI